jgi:D-alanine-D-alanine ligase
MKKLRIGIIYGGRSGEHEISLASAAAVFRNLDPERYEPVAIRIEKDGRWMLPGRPPELSSAADVIAASAGGIAINAERTDRGP